MLVGFEEEDRGEEKENRPLPVSRRHPSFAVRRRSRAEVAYQRLKISLSWLHLVFNNHQLVFKYHFSSLPASFSTVAGLVA